MNKMTPEMMAELTAQVSELVHRYSNDYQQFQCATYNETQVRVDFVNRFFHILGWDVDNERGLPQHLREVTHEATVVVEEDGVHRSKKPDYSFKVGTEVLFFLETKKPAVNITVDSAPAFQLRRYGWSGNLKISVLTNFTDLYIYDCSIRPREGDGIGVAMIAHYHFDEYIERFEEIYNLLSKEAALTGEFENRFENIRRAVRREPFDQYFLSQIKSWRNALGEDILQNNPDVDNETLNIFVQRILNRTIFLRICEDRCLENYESLRNITTYQELKTMFETADRKYDSGLFELLDEDRLIVSDGVLIEIFQSLYYPNNSYEFGVIEPYIIGQIYELFLDEKLEVQPDGHVVTKEKPEVVDSQGAVNTPKNITDIIVEETLQPLYTNKTLDKVSEYRIADICCGAGNFLLSAFEYICNYYIEFYQSNNLEDAVHHGDVYQLPGSTNYHLSYEIKRKILKNNIFGVDIDPLAVEVSKFSLLLKVLEGSTLEELEAYHQHTHNKILPNLDENIKNGNSLVDGTYAQLNRAVYTDISLMNKIKMFDWHSEFGDRGFDAIIGNPPYIQLQSIEHDADILERMEYETYARTGDIYCLFYEQGMNVLKENGCLCYITSNKWMRAGYGENLRNYFATKTNPTLLVDFAGVKIFDAATVEANILLTNKEANKYSTLACIFSDTNGLSKLSDFIQQQGVECEFSSSDSWVILSPIEQSIKRKIEAIGTPLKDWDINIYRGVLTGYNEAFIISTEKRNEILANCQSEEERQRTAELIRPILRGRDIKRYGYNWAGLWIIATFPSRHYNIEDFPAVKSYFLSVGIERLEQTGEVHTVNGEKIKARKKTCNKWFETQDSISYWEDFYKPKIVWKIIGNQMAFAYDKNQFIMNNACYIMTGEHLDYLLSILNSQAILWYSYVTNMNKTGVGDVQVGGQNIITFPIPAYSDNKNILAKMADCVTNQKISLKSVDYQIENIISEIFGFTTDERNFLNTFANSLRKKG